MKLRPDRSTPDDVPPDKPLLLAGRAAGPRARIRRAATPGGASTSWLPRLVLPADAHPHALAEGASRVK